MIETINVCKAGEYKKVMKVKFNSDDNLFLNKTLKLHTFTIIYRSAFEEDDKSSTRFFRWMFVWVIKMLQYEIIDVSEGIDINKSNKSK